MTLTKGGGIQRLVCVHRHHDSMTLCPLAELESGQSKLCSGAKRPLTRQNAPNVGKKILEVGQKE